jgi:hypothetical protein
LRKINTSKILFSKYTFQNEVKKSNTPTLTEDWIVTLAPFIISEEDRGINTTAASRLDRQIDADRNVCQPLWPEI